MKNFKVVMFDLDGTLLPMEQEEFIAAYFGALSAKLTDVGYEPKALINSVWQGTKAMIKNDGAKTNEQVFWDEFTRIYGESARSDLPHFDKFYRDDFIKVKAVCGYNPASANAVKKVKEMGYRVVLATNPIFPRTATRQRAEWAGLSLDLFEIVTTYENSRYSKPNPLYYTQIISALGVKPHECLMVGNDVYEDIFAGQQAGMSTFLITDCVLNDKKLNLPDVPSGNFDDLIEWLEK